MPIKSSPDGVGVVVDVRTPAELEEALDAIRWQVRTHFTDEESSPLVELMERIMEDVDTLVDPPPFRLTPLGWVRNTLTRDG